MKPGKMRERITIERQGEPIDDGYTTQPGEYGPHLRLWADWQPISGSEIFENLGREAKSGGYFFIRQSSDSEGITATDRAVWRGLVFDIVANDFHDETKRRLTVTKGDE